MSAPEDPHAPEDAPGEAPPRHVGPGHWSRARAGTNAEAMDYYRARSKAPGVAEGGGSRNYYCMQCDGVIAHDFAGDRCPHCDVALEGGAKRYFNWVEINEPPRSDVRALLPFLIAGVLVAAGAAWVIWRFLFAAGAGTRA